MRSIDRADPQSPAPGRVPGDRAALLTLIALVVGAFPLIVLYLGNQHWFYQDEWDFLVTRRATNVHDLLRPHNEHWSTLPVLVYRGLWSIFGLRTYLPYQSVVVALHLTTVVLLWVVLRRSGVSAWVSTITAATLILFGAGQADIVSAFNMSFVGSLAFGLTQLLLIDHPGRWDRRDFFGLAAGAAALMCSGIGVTMVVVVGIAALLHRGWRVAAAQTVPLAVLYLAWFAAEKPPTGSNPGQHGLVYILIEIAHFVADGVGATFRGLGHSEPVGILLAAVLLGGLWSACRSEGPGGLARRAASPVALLAGTVVLLTISGWGRWQLGPSYAAQSRYVYLAAATMLPALGVAIEALGTLWRPAVPVALLLLLIAVPGNIAQFRAGGDGAQKVAQRQLILSLPRSPLAHEVPPSVRPDPTDSFFVSIGWLLEQQRDGKLVDPGPVPVSVSSQIPLRLGLQQSLFPYRPKACVRSVSMIIRSPSVGARVVLAGSQAAISVRAGSTWSPPVVYNVAAAHLFMVRLPGLVLRVKPPKTGETLLVCH